jgi:hypothetical protein
VVLPRLRKASDYVARSACEQRHSYLDFTNLIALAVQVARNQWKAPRPIVAVLTRSDALLLGIMRWTMSLPIARVILIEDLGP